MAEAHLENRAPTTRARRRKYASVRGAMQHLNVLYSLEETGASGFDPERAAETANIDGTADGYRQKASQRMEQVRRLERALGAAVKRTWQEYNNDTIEVSPDEIWHAFGRWHIDRVSLSTIADELDLSRAAVRQHRIDRADGYVESALQACGLWLDARHVREDRSGYDAKQDYVDEDSYG